MRLAHLVPHLAGLRLDQLISTDDRLTLVVAGAGRTARCPCCRQPARRRHSAYHRTVADAPWGRRPTILRFRVRRFRCDNPACDRRIFAERFPRVVAEHARRTESPVAERVLADWDPALERFEKVMPRDFKRVLQRLAAERDDAEGPARAAAAADGDGGTTAGDPARVDRAMDEDVRPEVTA